MVYDLDYLPTKKQELFHKSTANEVLFGGAAGGGKSFAVVMDAIDTCLRYKGICVYVFRKTLRELEDTLIPVAREKIPDNIGSYKSVSHEIIFVNGSILRFRYLSCDQDKYKYQGAEINALYIDELTHFTKSQYDFLKSRLRANKSLNVKPFVRCTSNPGGVGHAFVKSYFIDVAPPYEIYTTTVKSEILDKVLTVKRQYIPALVTDNPHINDEYIFELENKPKALRDAFLLGKWDAFEGQVFSEWLNDSDHYEDRVNTHVITPFALNPEFKRYRSFDFGYSRPFSVLWWAVDTKGVAYLYKEWYGASGDNVGIKLTPSQIAIGILERDKGDSICASFADPSIWDSSRGDSVALQMEKEGVFFLPGDNARLSGKMALHDRFKLDESGKPSLYVFSTCRQVIRTIPALCYDPFAPEDIDTNSEDHIYDAMRYFLMSNVSKTTIKKVVKSKFNPLSDNPKDRLKSFL